MGQVLIFDTTLRDGVKSPGIILTVEEKVRIAKQLARLRVDILEAGFPAASEEEFEAVERIAKDVGGPTIAVLARASNPRDFDIAWEAVKHSERPRIHTFVPASREYREHFLKRSLEQTLELTASAIVMAKKYTPDVEFSLVDAFRASQDEVIQLARAAIKAGATTVNFADTIGKAMPSDVSNLFKRLHEELDDPCQAVLSIHCHNDLGLAVANSLAAVEAGAGQIHCTVNGIGERAGNTPLEEIVAALSLGSAKLNVETNVCLEQLYPASRVVRRLTGVNLQSHKPIVGSNAFFYETAVPQLADSTEKPPYEILRPENFGILPKGDILTADSDIRAFRERISELGYELEGEKLNECFDAFQELATKKDMIFDADLDLLIGARAVMERSRYKLLYLNVTAGSISVPNATVQMEVDGQVVQDAGFGHGPVDAAFKTILKIVKHFPKLMRYEVNAVTPGSDAQGEVSIRLREGGHLVDGRAIDTDIVLASARALVDGLNKLERVRVQPALSEFTDEESWMPRL